MESYFVVLASRLLRFGLSNEILSSSELPHYANIDCPVVTGRACPVSYRCWVRYTIARNTSGLMEGALLQGLVVAIVLFDRQNLQCLFQENLAGEKWLGHGVKRGQ